MLAAFVTIDPGFTDDAFDYFGPVAADAEWATAIGYPDSQAYEDEQAYLEWADGQAQADAEWYAEQRAAYNFGM